MEDCFTAMARGGWQIGKSERFRLPSFLTTFLPVYLASFHLLYPLHSTILPSSSYSSLIHLLHFLSFFLLSFLSYSLLSNSLSFSLAFFPAEIHSNFLSAFLTPSVLCLLLNLLHTLSPPSFYLSSLFFNFSHHLFLPSFHFF